MKKFLLKRYFFLKNYTNETISFFIAVLGAIIAYKFYTEPGLQFVSLVVLAITSYLIIIFLKLKSRDFFYIFFDNYNDKQGWVGSGTFELYPNEEAFVIKDSDAGFIFSRCFIWIDYKMNLEFKILKNTLGIIVRATDLSNKIMMQINIKANGIRPHLWANGGFLVFEPKASRLEFDTPIKEGRWYELSMQVNKDSMKIRIFENKKIILEKFWNIPTASLSFPIREKNKSQGKIEDSIGMLDIWKDYSYGTIGFRNGHGEEAIIRKLLIEKI